MLDGDTEKLQRHSSAGNSVAVLSGTAVSVEVVGLWTFTLNTGAIHGSGAVQLIVGVTPAAQTRLGEHVKRGKGTFKHGSVCRRDFSLV